MPSTTSEASENGLRKPARKEVMVRAPLADVEKVLRIQARIKHITGIDYSANDIWLLAIRFFDETMNRRRGTSHELKLINLSGRGIYISTENEAKNDSEQSEV